MQSEERASSATRPADGARYGFLEICTDSVAGARVAIAGGADQIELCAALALGGLTPSPGLVEAVVAVAAPAGVPVRAMIRPRPGDFAYDADELSIAARDARALLSAGAAGLVFGATRNRRIDWSTMDRWCDAARVDKVTLHRAIDTTIDPLSEVKRAVAAGIDQILSSGGQQCAIDGLALLAAMTAAAGTACRIVAGAGIDPDNAARLAAGGVRALHATARRRPVGDAPRPADPLGFGTAWPVPDIAIVTALRQRVDNANV